MSKSIGLHEVAIQREKLNRMRHIFGNDENGGIVSHNILNAFLSAFEDPAVTGARYGLPAKKIIEIRDEAMQAIDDAWIATFGDTQPEPSKATVALPTHGELALDKYLEGVCKGKA